MFLGQHAEIFIYGRFSGMNDVRASPAKNNSLHTKFRLFKASGVARNFFEAGGQLKAIAPADLAWVSGGRSPPDDNEI